MSRSGQDMKADQRRVERRSASSRGAPPDFDTHLMLQVRAGDAEAANLLIRRNFDRVARYVGRVVRDRKPIEDLTQEVFVSVLDAAPRYEPTARFSTWLYRIATNTARSYLSRASTRRAAKGDAGVEPRDPPAPVNEAPDEQLSVDELRARVSSAIGRLPVNQRIALTLFQYEELSYEQIAAVLDVTVESVRNLLKRARAALREQLGGLS